MNIKNDYSYLFNSMNNNAKSDSSNIFNAIDLSEYHSIKSGNYGKLLKAYYAKDTVDSSDDTKDTDKKKTELKKDTEIEKLTEVSGKADTLQDSAEKLISRGSDSLFVEKEMKVKDAEGKETTVMDYDKDAIYNAVKDFTTKYNSFLSAVKDSGSSRLDQETDALTLIATDYTTQLEKAGISINKEDHTLSVDEKTFKAAEVDDLKKLFNGNASFTYKVASKASMVGATAESEANTMKNYTSNGTYDQALSSGNLLDSLI